MIRGPASAVWGANALNGVINFISKTPRELAGNSATIGFGAFNREVNDNGAGNRRGSYSINATHARAVNDRWAYKISAGGYTSGRVCAADRARSRTTPTRRIRRFATTAPAQPKFDTRVDYDAPTATTS